MALKMAKGSLFAILLRSPWWISLVVVGLIVLVSNALLSPELRVFGWTAAFPFVVIAALALRRQWGQPSAKQQALDWQRLQALGQEAFALALVKGFERKGYTVEVINDARDPWVDLVLTRNDSQTVVSYKRRKMAHPGADTLRALDQARAKRKADQALFLHFFDLTDVALQWQKSATTSTLRCVTGQELVEMVPPL
jgi:restriction system protein